MKKLLIGMCLGTLPLMADCVEEHEVILEQAVPPILMLDTDTFAEGISEGVVVVDFYADWCGPCRRFASVFAKVADELFEVATFAKLNISTSSFIADKYHIKSIPTVIIFRHGKELTRHSGSLSEEALMNFVQEALGE